MRFLSKTYYLVVGAIFLVLIVFHYTGLLEPIENRLRSAFVPFFSDFHGLSISVGDNYEFFTNRDAFFEAYTACVRKSENSTVLSSKLTTLTNENDELRRQLNYFQKKNSAHLLANVIGRELLSTDQTIIIDIGKQSGVTVGDPVIVGDGILIGEVSKVEENTAIVRLLNDNESRVGALVQNKDKSQGVIEGGFGISLQMNLIPRDETILAGQKVITSGLELTIPKGLLIGTIAAVENEPYKPFQQAIITPATNLDKLEIVSVLLTK